MPTADEIQRIASVMHTLRPDWRPGSLVTFLTRHHQGRTYRDLLIAGVVVATDPRTKTPELLNQHGPWWAATQAAFAHTADHRFERCQEPGHGSFPAANCSACRSEDLEHTHHVTESTEDRRDMYARGARTVRAALATHRAMHSKEAMS